MKKSYKIWIALALFITPLSCKNETSSLVEPPDEIELPVESSNITAILYEGKAHLSWQNPQEQNAEIYFDGKKIGDAENTASSFCGSYSYFVDENSYDGKEYIVKLKDAHGQTSGTLATKAVETGLPVVEIMTNDGEEPVCEYVSSPPGENGAGITNNEYVKGAMRIILGDEIIYESGAYEKDTSGMRIKIRGNTSAYSDKKPYKIKLSKKADLLFRDGKTNNKYKDKEWLLLKDGTSLNTVVGMKTADLCGIEWTPEFTFVDVIMNGNYRGSYLLIESVKQSEVRCDVNEDDGFVIEDDAYWWNEDKYFQTELSREFTFKHPDPDDVTEEQMAYIKDCVQNLENTLKDGNDYSHLIDEESFVSWLVTHDILGTWDSAGSNIYITKKDSTGNSPLAMTTPWDFDSNYRMKNTWANIHSSRIFYYNYLIKYDSFKNSYSEKFRKVSPKFEEEIAEELENLKMTQGEAIDKSRSLDAKKWGGKATAIEDDIATAKNWFSERLPWISANINDL